ncbi:hypothetical protein ACLIX5_004450 [Salmonella enterica subsp. enterica serovar Bredeney]
MNNKAKQVAAQILCLVLAGFFTLAGSLIIGGVLFLAALAPVFRFLIMGPKS